MHSLHTAMLSLLIFIYCYSPHILALLLNQDWDLNLPCQKYVQRLAHRAEELTFCAINNSIPPQVCTKCIQQYINLKHEIYQSKHLNDVYSEDNKTCTAVIYENYVLSYSEEFFSTIDVKIWQASRCDSCLHIHWDYQYSNSTYQINNQTQKFMSFYEKWHDCVLNTTDDHDKRCDECNKEFERLFRFYWEIYIEPDVFFCIDIDSTMNDTIHYWIDFLGCDDPQNEKGRPEDIKVVAFSATILLIIIGLFYAGSYIQLERAQANLIQYSRMQEPRGPRFRLLSSSTLDRENQSTPGSSQHGWQSAQQQEY